MTGSTLAASIIVPAYRADATLSHCVEALLAQDLDQPFEVIVVVSADTRAEISAVPPDVRVRVIEHVPRLSSAAARNRGAAVAAGPALAFTDAHVYPEPAWLRTALVASDNLTMCVAGAVLNGTPESAVGTAEYLAAFLDLHPARPRTNAWHGATCNLLVPRDLWDQYGPFAEDVLGGEDTLLTSTVHRDGRLLFCPDAAVTHMNRTRGRAVIAHQYLYGRFTAHIARQGPYHHGALVRRAALAPLAGGGRVIWALTRARRRARLSLARIAASAPTVVGALVAWSVGLLIENLRLGRAERRARRQPR